MNDLIAYMENISMEFVNTFQDKLKWEWDDRFEAVLSTCKTEAKDDIQFSIKFHLKTIWDNSNTEGAPDVILGVMNHFGGLMPGQFFFTSDLHKEILLCCAWWPWGDGETVSIRVLPYSNKLTDDYRAALKKKFRNCFRI